MVSRTIIGNKECFNDFKTHFRVEEKEKHKAKSKVFMAHVVRKRRRGADVVGLRERLELSVPRGERNRSSITSFVEPSTLDLAHFKATPSKPA